MNIDIIRDFENKLRYLGFQFESLDTNYLIHRENRDLQIKVQLLISETTDPEVHGSHNGFTVEAIGYFVIKSYFHLDELEFIIMAFPNQTTDLNEYIVLPIQELNWRLTSTCWLKAKISDIRLQFWLFPDRTLYETHNLSPEGEWFMLSKGCNGRLADDREMNYTPFLNSWSFLYIYS